MTASSMTAEVASSGGKRPRACHRRPDRWGCTGWSSRRACCRRRPGGSTPRPAIWPDEVRVRLERLNLDAASFRQLHEAHGGDPDAIRSAVLGIVAERGKMQNPVTGSGGMLTGVVDEVGPGVAARAARRGSGSPPWCRCR